jgi:hypothetical protein
LQEFFELEKLRTMIFACIIISLQECYERSIIALCSKQKQTDAYLSFCLQMPAHDLPVKSNLSIHELNTGNLFCSK